MKLLRPLPHRGPDKLPFSETPGAFEGFLATWNFLICFGCVCCFLVKRYFVIIDPACRHVLHLSSFTLDDYEHALRHSLSDPPCNLLAEIHSVLIYNLRTIPYERHASITSLRELEYRNKCEGHEDGVVSIDDLVSRMEPWGNNWERVPLKHSDGRTGWQGALIGCLKDVSEYLATCVSQPLTEAWPSACYNGTFPSPS